MEADKAAAEKKEAEEKAAAERKAAEEKRIAEEKAKREADRKAVDVRKRQDEENAREQIARNDNAAVRESIEIKPAPQEAEKKREFFQEAAVAEAKDYGPIPDRKYTWLANGNPDAPQKQTFLLANGAKLELMPQKAATFYMTNEPDDLKGWHKVTLTRPFWMTRTCVTVDQWREFAPNDCEDCRDVEKALDGKAILCIRLSRKSIDEFCAYLTAKYSKQLPKGYVFRLPSEAEWEYVLDFEAVFDKYHKPNMMSWIGFVGIGSVTFRERFSPVRTGKSTLLQIREDGCWEGHRYRIAGLALPQPSGVVDMYGERRLVLDIIRKNSSIGYEDEEIDPLRWSECLYDGGNSWQVLRDGERERKVGPYYDLPYLCHVVVGPDLIGGKAWQNKRENIDINAVVPRQRAKLDPKKIPNKINKPREVALKRVGGKEMIFCEIPKGRFNMSNVNGQSKAYHRVELTKPFWMSKFLVSADEWREYAPADFNTRAVKTTEKLFPKNPICIRNSYRRWEAFCAFLNKRYGSLLPDGYVFRLPTEAEWEWAYIADEKGDVRQMAGGFCSDDGGLRKEFAAMLKKAGAPAELNFDTQGFIGDAYVGGRTRKTGFGVSDIVVHYFRNHIMLDTFDTAGMVDEKGNERTQADAAVAITYDDKEVDPVRYAGRRGRFIEIRGNNGGRDLRDAGFVGVAHIVIAPDVLKPLKERELEPYPQNDFGGVYIGEKVTRADQSSKRDGDRRNSEKQFKRMVSRENVVIAKFEKREETAGFMTEHEESPWIMLDLGKSQPIAGMVIEGYERGTCHLCVWVSDDGKHEKLVDKESLQCKRYRIDLQKKNVKGRYIRIGREPKIEKNWFFLDKVVIYGKEK